MATTDTKAEKVQRAYKYAQSLRAPHEENIRLAYRYVQPAREFMKVEDSKPDKKQLYDSTSTFAVRQLVNHVIDLLVPQNRQWARVVLANKKLKQSLESALATQLVEWNDGLNRHFLKSNFYLALTESMYDAIIAGTACVAIYDEIGKPIEYMSIPIDQIFFTQDYRGKVDQVFRRSELTGRQLQGRFGSKLPKDCADTCEESPEKKFPIVECVTPEDGNFCYCVFLEQSWDLIEEKDSPFNPFVVWRWEKVLAETWGTSPVRDALPDIVSLNIMERDLMKAGNFAADPCYQVSDDVMNIDNVRNNVKPGGVVVVPATAELKLLPQGSNFPITLEIIQERRARLMDMLYANSLGMNPVKNTYMTAEEVGFRKQLFYSQAGQPARRLESELLKPIVLQVFNRELLRGELEPLTPQYVQALNVGARTMSDIITVDTDAAINRAIKQSEAQSNLQAIVAITQALGGQLQLVSKQIDFDKTVRSAAEGFSLSPDLLRTPKEIAELEKQLAQQQMMQLQMGIAAQQAKQNPQPQPNPTGAA